jgi:hypothetical protein
VKKTAMTAKDRRALTLGLSVVLPALFFVFGVKPYLAAVKDTKAKVYDERRRLSSELAAIAAAKKNPDLQRKADSGMRAMAPRLFTGHDDNGAAADMANQIGVVALQHDVVLKDATPRPSTSDPSGVHTLHVQISAESDLQGLLGFVEELERGEKLLRIDRLDITPSRAKADAAGVQPLTISGMISGFVIREPGSTDSTIRSRPAPPPARGR